MWIKIDDNLLNTKYIFFVSKNEKDLYVGHSAENYKTISFKTENEVNEEFSRIEKILLNGEKE